MNIIENGKISGFSNAPNRVSQYDREKQYVIDATITSFIVDREGFKLFRISGSVSSENEVYVSDIDTIQVYRNSLQNMFDMLFVGKSYRFYCGTKYKYSEEYGNRQFTANICEISDFYDAKTTKIFIKSNVKGIGEKTIEKLTDRFDDIPFTLRNKRSEFIDICKKEKILNEKQMAALLSLYDDVDSRLHLMSSLKKYGLNEGQAQSVISYFERRDSDANKYNRMLERDADGKIIDSEENKKHLKKTDVLSELVRNKYIIAKIHGIGFKVADKVAWEISKDYGTLPLYEISKHRFMAAIDYCVSLAEDEGHTYITKENNNRVYGIVHRIFHELGFANKLWDMFVLSAVSEISRLKEHGRKKTIDMPFEQKKKAYIGFIKILSLLHNDKEKMQRFLEENGLLLDVKKINEKNKKAIGILNTVIRLLKLSTEVRQKIKQYEDIIDECLLDVQNRNNIDYVSLTSDKIWCIRKNGSKYQTFAYYNEKTYKAERNIAEKSNQYSRMDSPIDIAVASKMLSEICSLDGIELQKIQFDAILELISSKYAILIGSAGSGKTTVTRYLFKLLKRINENLEMTATAFTGVAAQRSTNVLLSEKNEKGEMHVPYNSEKFKNIHSLLQAMGIGEDNFKFNENNKLPYDTIIIDEFGMVSLHLFNSLLAAIKIDAQIIMVGDPNQLESISCGNLLQDLIQSKKIKTVSLGNTPVRQRRFKIVNGVKILDNEWVSDIIKHSKSILEGKTPKIERLFKMDDAGKPMNMLKNGSEEYQCLFCDMEKDIPKNMTLREFISILYLDKLPKYFNIESKNIQILTPNRKNGEHSINGINAIIQGKIFNTGYEEIVFDREEERKKPLSERLSRQYIEKDGMFYVLRVGDLVLQTKNNKEIQLFDGEKKFDEKKAENRRINNGEFGEIIEFFLYDNIKIGAIVSIGGEYYKYNQSQLRELELRYAMTIHKSQGSEYPIVIAVIPKTYNMTRNMLYTALTRGKQFVLVVSTEEAMTMAVRNNKQEYRQTYLKERLIMG